MRESLHRAVLYLDDLLFTWPAADCHGCCSVADVTVLAGVVEGALAAVCFFTALRCCGGGRFLCERISDHLAQKAFARRPLCTHLFRQGLSGPILSAVRECGVSWWWAWRCWGWWSGCGCRCSSERRSVKGRNVPAKSSANAQVRRRVQASSFSLLRGGRGSVNLQPEQPVYVYIEHIKPERFKVKNKTDAQPLTKRRRTAHGTVPAASTQPILHTRRESKKAADRAQPAAAFASHVRLLFSSSANKHPYIHNPLSTNLCLPRLTQDIQPGGLPRACISARHIEHEREKSNFHPEHSLLFPRT